MSASNLTVYDGKPLPRFPGLQHRVHHIQGEVAMRAPEKSLPVQVEMTSYTVHQFSTSLFHEATFEDR